MDMKIFFNGYIRLMLWTICTPAMLFAQAQGIDSTFDNQHYRTRLEFFKAMPNQEGEIIFVGNSITEGGKWQEIIQQKHIINRGISGDVTYGILARLSEIVASKPRKIFLLCGVNDMKRGIPVPIIAANIERIVVQIKTQSPKTELFVQSVLPVHEGLLPNTYQNVRNEKITILNRDLMDICAKHQIRFVDLHPILTDRLGQLKAELTIDGLHLKQATYLIWVDDLKKQKLL